MRAELGKRRMESLLLAPAGLLLLYWPRLLLALVAADRQSCWRLVTRTGRRLGVLMARLPAAVSCVTSVVVLILAYCRDIIECKPRFFATA